MYELRNVLDIVDLRSQLVDIVCFNPLSIVVSLTVLKHVC